MRGHGGALTAAALAVMLTAGCAKTPDSVIVRQKGSESLESYKEAGAEEEEGTAAQSDGGYEKNTLAEKLQVPDVYQASVKSEDGSFELTCDGEIRVPNVEKASVWKVSQKAFTQEFIDTVTQTFFGDAPVYDSFKYFEPTREEALEKLNQLKAWQAEGNLDPYGYNEGQDSQEGAQGMAFDIQADIDQWQTIYDNAPEEKQLLEVHPGFGVNVIENDDGTQNAFKDNFFGAVEMDGQVFSYNLSNSSEEPMDIQIIRSHTEGNPGSESWYPIDFDYAPDTEDSGGNPSREEVLERVGISDQEAIALADSYMEGLGLLGEFSAKGAWLSSCTVFLQGERESGFQDVGWQVDYTRDLDGFPVTDEMNYGGGLESREDVTTTPWCYERVEFTVNGKGLQQVHIMNLYDVGERQTENVELLSFPEIAGIFEQMMEISKSNMDHVNWSKYQVERAELGYMRIYDPQVESFSGLLVPVWDFFGTCTRQSEYDGTLYEDTDSRETNSFMTVNAVDGTIIDRSLGY